MKGPEKIVTGSILITIFVLLVSLTSLYVQAEIQQGSVCTCAIPLPVLIPLLASIGMLVGTLVYYLFSPMKEAPKNDSNLLLKLLNETDATVIRVLMENRGEVSQARIAKLTGFPKVKVFRSLERLRAKGTIKKISKGKTNTIKLDDNTAKLLR